MRLVLFNIFKFSALGMPNIEKLIIIFLLRLKVKKNKIHKKNRYCPGMKITSSFFIKFTDISFNLKPQYR